MLNQQEIEKLIIEVMTKHGIITQDIEINYFTTVEPRTLRFTLKLNGYTEAK